MKKIESYGNVTACSDGVWSGCQEIRRAVMTVVRRKRVTIQKTDHTYLSIGSRWRIDTISRLFT